MSQQHFNGRVENAAGRDINITQAGGLNAELPLTDKQRQTLNDIVNEAKKKHGGAQPNKLGQRLWRAVHVRLEVDSIDGIRKHQYEEARDCLLDEIRRLGTPIEPLFPISLCEHDCDRCKMETESRWQQQLNAREKEFEQVRYLDAQHLQTMDKRLAFWRQATLGAVMILAGVIAVSTLIF